MWVERDVDDVEEVHEGHRPDVRTDVSALEDEGPVVDEKVKPEGPTTKPEKTTVEDPPFIVSLPDHSERPVLG